MRTILIFTLFIGSVAMATAPAPSSICYLEKDSADLLQDPAIGSPAMEQCPRIFYGEKLTVVRVDGDWLKVLVAGGWSGWLQYRDGGKEFIATAGSL